jgi:hypothetical protein
MLFEGTKETRSITLNKKWALGNIHRTFKTGNSNLECDNLYFMNPVSKKNKRVEKE